MGRHGFTLTEVLIACVIISILAAMAVPQFQRTTERSYWRSARDILETIYAGEQVYYLQEDSYKAFDTRKAAGDFAYWRPIFMDNPNMDRTIPVAFQVAIGGGGTTFLSTVTRSGGRCNAKTQTIDHNHTRGGTWPEQGC